MKKPSREEMFLNIFADIGFPFLALDLFELSKAIKSRKEPHSHIEVPLVGDASKNDALKGAFRGIFRGIEPPTQIFRLLESSELLSAVFDSSKTIQEQIESPSNIFGIYTTDKLIWEEKSFWPLAYNVIVGQMLNILQVFEAALINRKKEFSKLGINVSITSEYPRNMPTALHYAVASLGAWIGGSDNFQFISHFASKPQILNSEINVEYGKRIGYNEQDSIELDKSGIINIPASLSMPLMEMQGESNLFGTLAIDEFNIVNLPDNTEILKKADDLISRKLYGSILDKYYRTPFIARKLKNVALYGANDVLRDHYEDFFSNIEHSELIRCKHYCAPIVEVSSFDEMLNLVSKIPKRGSGELFFRGQTKCYSIYRTNKVKKLLFGESTSNEPSLITSASRNNFNYDNLHFALKFYFGQEILFSKNASIEEFKKKNAIWREMSLDPTCTYDYAIMALSQHYGLPSHGLDVTTNLDVALWFATNQYKSNEEGFSYYQKIDSTYWTKDKNYWPIIFVFQPVLNTVIPSLQTCKELKQLNIRALRPERQSAKFFLGGHSDHQNRLAEAIVCAFRLKPSDYQTVVNFDYLFPKPQEDIAYAEMLNLEKVEMFKGIIDGKVNKFHK